jgi:Protein of unknown function (DUF4058)
MPIHDWTEVEAGIFHAFHHGWITSISNALNSGLLPKDLYALPEQIAAGYGPDVLTLQNQRPSEVEGDGGEATAATALQTRPKTTIVAATEIEYYSRKKSSIAVRHVSGDEIVAMIEIVSPGNKSGQRAMRSFVEKACELIENRIHLLIVDLYPPGPRDPDGVHGLIWQEISDEPFHLPESKPLTLVSYECELVTRAQGESVAVGDVLPNMPLFLEPNGCIMVPLESTYMTAFNLLPRRWRDVLQPSAQ